MAAPDVAAGERLIGVRLGGAVTRSAPWRIADQEPELGWLTGAMRLPSGQPVPEQPANAITIATLTNFVRMLRL